MNPTQKSPERAFALQKYLLLHSQHDAVRKHLTKIAASLPSTANPSPIDSPDRFRYSATSTSPDRFRLPSLSSSPGSSGGSSFSSSPPTPIRHHRRSGSIENPRPERPKIMKRRSSLPILVDETILEEIEEDEMRLKDVNQQIKSTLTDLLNCESVRVDDRYRKWVQTRLMDTEQELKSSRSRSCDRKRSEDMGRLVF